MGAEQSLQGLIECKCRIVVLGPRNSSLAPCLAGLPPGARILATGSSLEDLQRDSSLLSEANVLLHTEGNLECLKKVIDAMPFLAWIHTLYSNVDEILPAVLKEDIMITNAKGCYSDSVAEYVLGSCWYFTKNIRNILVGEEDNFAHDNLHGKTMGIVGYGNIGQHCARLARGFGMKVLGLRYTPHQNAADQLLSSVYGPDDLDAVMEQSDFLVIALPLTDSTKSLINDFTKAKKDMVLINVGSPALLPYKALLDGLSPNGLLKGAVLHRPPSPGQSGEEEQAVPINTEAPAKLIPQPKEIYNQSRLKENPRVLISPSTVHTGESCRLAKVKAIEIFNKNCEAFLGLGELDNIVLQEDGY